MWFCLTLTQWPRFHTLNLPKAYVKVNTSSWGVILVRLLGYCPMLAYWQTPSQPPQHYIFQYSSTSTEIINNNAFLDLPSNTGLYERDFRERNGCQVSGLDHGHSLTEAIAGDKKLAVLHTQPDISFTSSCYTSTSTPIHNKQKTCSFHCVIFQTKVREQK